MERGAQLLGQSHRIRVLCHYDPDGAAAAAILVKTIARKGLQVHVTLSSTLDEEGLRKFKELGNDLTIVADMGSGQLSLLGKLEDNVLVLDHHKPNGRNERVVHANPHLVGIDGARDVSGSVLAWIFSMVVNERNWDMAGTAMAGAIGDRQHVGGYVGLNAALFQEAVVRGTLVKERMLSLRDMPLEDALAHSLSPYIVGLTGRHEACAEFLRALEIDPGAEPRKLSAKSRKTLTSMLAIRLLRQGAQPEAIKTLVEEKYWIPDMDVHSEELSALINSCSRLGREGLGVSLALGDQESRRQAEILRENYFNQIIRYLHELEKGMFTKKHVQFFYCSEPTLAGAVAGIGMQYFFDGTRPVIAFSVLESITKVSSRGTRGMVGQGLDLAAAMNDAAVEVGGHGGGHNIAAGATIAKGKEERFLSLVDEIVDKQLKVKSEA